MQRALPSRASHATGDGEVAAAKGVGGDEALTDAGATAPAGEVMGDHVERQPRRVGAEAPRRQMVEPDAVLEVADRVFDLGVAAMIGLELERVAVAVGDEGVIRELDE